MTRDSLLETIDRFWKVRMAGDKAELRSFMAPDATYEMVGAQAFAEPGLVGPAPAGPAADRLIDAFAFHRVDRLTAIVDGSRAADVIRVEVSLGGGTPVKTEACDLWEFDDAGKVKSLRQFVDTALVNRLIEGRA
jgi:ketosteroid isomerase-like protein